MDNHEHLFLNIGNMIFCEEKLGLLQLLNTLLHFAWIGHERISDVPENWRGLLARHQESCLQQYPLKLQANPSWFERLDLKGLTMPWSLTSNAYKAGWSANTFLRGCNCYSCRSICWPRTKETKAEPFHCGFRKETSTVSTKLPMRPNAPPTSAACQLHKARPLERVLNHQIHQIHTCDLKKAYILEDFGV